MLAVLAYIYLFVETNLLLHGTTVGMQLLWIVLHLFFAYAKACWYVIGQYQSGYKGQYFYVKIINKNDANSNIMTHIMSKREHFW